MRSELSSTGNRRPSPRSRRLAVQALAVMFALGGGVLVTSPSALGERDGAAPYVDARVDAAPTPALQWTDCQDGFQCSTAHVPLDYDQPNDTQIHLAVIKLPASDPTNRIGTLFVNFGGPGPSGVDRLRARARWPWLFSEELRSHFDLVSWDPRGVSHSTAVRCFRSEAEQQAFLDSFPEMPARAGRWWVPPARTAAPALFAPTERLGGWLDGLSRMMPLQYAAQKMTDLTGVAQRRTG